MSLGSQGPTLHAFDANNIDWDCTGMSMIGVVDAPAGNVAIELRVRVGEDSAAAGAMLQVDNMMGNATTTQVASLSAIVLD